MAQVLEYIMEDKIWYTKGMTRYSDLSMIVLGLIVERIARMPLEVFTAKEIFEPVRQIFLCTCFYNLITFYVIEEI